MLMAIRTLGRSEAGNPDDPILAGAKLTPYVLTEEVPDQEAVLALMGRFWTQNAFAPILDRAAFAESPTNYVRTVWSLRLEDAPGGTRVTAETRVQNPADPAAAGKFRTYWYLVGRVGSAVFSLSVLASLRRRFCSGTPAPVDPANACATDMPQMLVTLAMAAAALGALVGLLGRARKRGAGLACR
jgi:hypothetical protein